MKNFLIVGGGLAGLTLAYHLNERGQKVTVCDKGENKSSRIAAGLINPMVFRRMTKSWRVDEFVPFAKTFYRSIEKEAKEKIFNDIIIRRFFAHEHELNLWQEKQKEQEFQNYLNKLTDEDLNYHYPKSKNPFGTGRINNASWINVELFIQATSNYLKNRGVEFTKAVINERELIADDFHFKNEQYDAVVLCTGFEIVFSELFKGKMINPTKGQILMVKSSEIPSDESINRKCFVLPLGNGEFRVGSTYEWQCTDDSISEEGKKDILEMLNYLGDYEVKVVGQKAGIRPATVDRRPLMGQHPIHEKLYIFNGLGTKGYMMAPLLAKEMAEFILEGKALDPETNVLRFMK